MDTSSLVAWQQQTPPYAVAVLEGLVSCSSHSRSRIRILTSTSSRSFHSFFVTRKKCRMKNIRISERDTGARPDGSEDLVATDEPTSRLLLSGTAYNRQHHSPNRERLQGICYITGKCVEIKSYSGKLS